MGRLLHLLPARDQKAVMDLLLVVANALLRLPGDTLIGQGRNGQGVNGNRTPA